MTTPLIDRIRRSAFRLRGGIWTVLYLLMLFTAKPSPARIGVGLVLVLAGQMLRFWAVGCIVLYRGEEVKARQLVTWGPYSLFRNPLYVGNGLIGLGWGVMAGLRGFAVFLAAFVILYGFLIIPWEERFLQDKFGDAYLKYCDSVGAFGPKKWPPKIKKGPFEPSVIWKSEIHSLVVTFLGTAVMIFGICR